MSIDNIIQLFESSDIKGLGLFCIENGLSLTHIRREDNQGKAVEEGDEIISVYTWEPVAENSQHSFKGIHFRKWREDVSTNLLEIHLNEETFNRFMNELGSAKVFKKSYLRRKNGKDRRFTHLTNKIDLRFIHRQTTLPFMPNYEYYTVVITRHYK